MTSGVAQSGYGKHEESSMDHLALHLRFPPLGLLTEPKDSIQGHVLSYVKQGRHGQLVGQSQSGSKIEAVAWGISGHLVSGTH